MSDDFKDTVKSVRRIDREKGKAVREMKNELFRVMKAYPKDKDIQEIVTIAKGIGLNPTPPRGPRTRKEHVKSHAERQRAYRERQKEEGKSVRWTYDDKLDPVYRRINLVIHKSSINVCKKEPGLEMYLEKVLELLDKHLPLEVPQDLAEFFKVLGLKPH